MIDGFVVEAQPGERLIDVINRAGIQVPQVCYHPQLGPIQTCDMYEVRLNQTVGAAMSESDRTTRRTRSETRRPGRATPHSRAAREMRPAKAPPVPACTPPAGPRA